jgi:hypothetical protein
MLTESYNARELLGSLVVPPYRLFGRQLAGLLQRQPGLQGLFRPLFDRMVVYSHRRFAARLVG